MIAMTLHDIAVVVAGTVTDAEPDLVVSGDAFLDSRHVVPGGLFVAVPGERVDGHAFAADAVRAGASAALTSHPVGVASVVVEDPVHALGLLARHVVRLLPDLTVIGLTGSQGKTSTKDMLAQLLEPHGETVAPTGSFNNEIGVPLTALRATPATRYLVSEMGARGRGHISYLASMLEPDIGLVLNVGVAHLGEFGSRELIAAAKGELVEALASTGTAVLNADDPLVAAMRSRTAAPVMTFGAAPDTDVRLGDVQLDEAAHACFTLSWREHTATIRLQLVGAHQADNAAAAVAAAVAAGVDFDEAASTLSTVTSRSPWRMEVDKTADGVTVVNDAYNANPDSMKAALKALADLGHRTSAGEGRTIAVLGEMRELGASSLVEHEAIGRLAVRLDIAQLVVVGEQARPLHLGALSEGSWAGESVWVPDAASAVRALEGVVRGGDIVLVKASRAAGLEIVAAALLGDGGSENG